MVGFVETYLPVFLPVFFVIISVLSGIVTRRIALNPSSLLKIHSDLVLGLFSFVIWAIVTYQQSAQTLSLFSRQIILLNQNTELSITRVTLLLILDIILLITSIIILNNTDSEDKIKSLKFNTSENNETRSILSKKTKNIINGGFLFITIVVIFAPIMLSNKISTSKRPEIPYKVSIAYKDPALLIAAQKYRYASHVPFEVCENVDILAIDRADALQKANAIFNGRHPKSLNEIDQFNSLVELQDEDPHIQVANQPALPDKQSLNAH